MSKTTTYILKSDRHTRIVGKGDDRTFERYVKGDAIECTPAEAERLKGAIELPGESARVEAERLKAQAEAFEAEAKAAQERADAAAEVADAGGAAPEPETSPEAEREAELKKLKRADLDKVAAKAGVTDPDKLPNIGEVVKATLAAEAAAAPAE